jgi:protein phosphatase PTC1
MLESFYGLSVFCKLLISSRRGKAVRLSYDHKGTDEAEGRRIAAAGGLILNSRVNGTLSSSSFLSQAYLL